jgi:imidazolonepropionase-like amidohydrolase
MTIASTSTGHQTPVVLTGVTVVDTREGTLSKPMNVSIAGGRIARISDEVGTGQSSPIDASGCYLVPGYLEMHSHALNVPSRAGALELMLTSGITGFRQMAGSDEMLAEWHSGTLELPEDSPEVLSIPGSVLTPANAATAEAAVATVRQQQEAGADFIKVGYVTPPVFFEAQAEAGRLGIPILGHLPTGIDAVAASTGGMRAIEHLGPGVGVLSSCSTEKAAILELLAAPSGPPALPPLAAIPPAVLLKMTMNPVLMMSSPTDRQALAQAIDTFSEAAAEELAARFVTDETWHCVTLIRERTCYVSDLPEFRDDPEHRYVATSTLELWEEVRQGYEALPQETKELFHRTYDTQLALTKLFDAAGVKIIAGSDSSGALWEVPGFSLHREFDELARAGLSPLRVLQTTTLDAAEYLGMQDSLGTVEEGKRADLVLLGKNPTEHADHLHDVVGVVRAGRYYAPEDLSAIRAHVAEQRSAE